MTAGTKKLLLDVREAGDSILQHTQGRTLAEYSADRFFRRAVEREFEIIGEALNRLDRLDANMATHHRTSAHRGFSQSNHSWL